MNIKWKSVDKEQPKEDMVLIGKGSLSKSHIVCYYELGRDMFFTFNHIPVKVSHFVYLDSVFEAINDNGEE